MGTNVCRAIQKKMSIVQPLANDTVYVQEAADSCAMHVYNVSLFKHSRIEVEWNIHNPNTTKITKTWFKATYIGVKQTHTQNTTNEGSTCHTICYDKKLLFLPTTIPVQSW